MLGFPMGIDAIPSVALELMSADWADPGTVSWRLVLTAKALPLVIILHRLVLVTTIAPGYARLVSFLIIAARKSEIHHIEPGAHAMEDREQYRLVPVPG
jgi:hypothetical protein